MSLTLLGVRAGVSGTQALMQMRSSKDQKKMMKYQKDKQLELIATSSAKKTNAMQETYLMSLRDMNDTFATTVGAITREKDKARSMSALSTVVNPNVNIAGSSGYNDGIQAVSDEYESTVTKAGMQLNENVKRMSKMNVEKRMDVQTSAEKMRLDTMMEYDVNTNKLDKQRQGAMLQFGADALTYGVAKNTADVMAWESEVRKNAEAEGWNWLEFKDTKNYEWAMSSRRGGR